VNITRRDFLNGVALAVPGVAAAQGGLDGQTDAVMAGAHRVRHEGRALWHAVAERDDGIEDLVVVGSGLSGLAGAWLYRQHAGRPVRLLLLDALQRPGGHSQRNEFVSRSGRRLIGYGGSQSLDTPGLFSTATHQLLQALGIELQRFKTEFFDSGWARRQGLTRSARWFDPTVWGAGSGLVLREADEPAPAWLARTPLPPAAQAVLLQLQAGGPPPVPLRGTALARRRRLAAITYERFLQQHWQAPSAVLAWFQQDTRAYFGVGIDATSALDAWASGLPGFGGLGLGDGVDPLMSASARQVMAGQDEYVYHFPDGNAGVAHALLRQLVPEAVPGTGMVSLADVRVDPAALDRADAPVRVRQRCNVVRLRHLGPPGQARLVEVRYLAADGTLHEVRARQVLLACWHRVIPHLTDELPAAQRRALADQVKTPLLYATVLVSNWRPWQRAGVRSIKAPGGFWAGAELDFPVSMGGVRFPQSADEPMLLHLGQVVVPGGGGSPRQQAAAGRKLLEGWRFEHLEGEVRRLLQGALGGHGFDAGRDIEAITINRWAHGYSLEYARPWDRFWPHGPLPCESARRGWGRVAIAGADSGAYAYAHSAIDQATRAVQELLPQARLPRGHPVPGPDPKAIGL
jgi:spermidine dehydrogenase